MTASFEALHSLPYPTPPTHVTPPDTWDPQAAGLTSGLMAQYVASAGAIWQYGVARIPDLSLEILPSLPSTNTTLLERARHQLLPPTFLIAVEQTAGRGRRGKRWQSQGEHSLTFSLAWPIDAHDQVNPTGGPSASRTHSANLAGLSLAVGVCLAQALGPPVRVKWPNDLCLVDSAGHLSKLGGILIETAPIAGGTLAVIGVGINLQPIHVPELVAPGEPALQRDSHPPSAYSTASSRALPATSVASLATLGALQHEHQRPTSAPQMLTRIAPRLLDALQRFTREGFAAFHAAYDERDALAHHPVDVYMQADAQTPAYSGLAQGVTPDGALLVHTPNGLQTVNSGEVSVRLHSL